MNKKVILIIIIVLILIIGLVFLMLRGSKNNENAITNNSVQNTQENDSTKDSTISNNAKYQYDYKDGVLTQIVDEDGNPRQTDFIIDGIILVGNRHSYENITDSQTVIEKLANLGYKKDGINSSFYLNEWIDMYIDTKYSGSESDVKILVTPHKPVEELEKMSLTKLEELANDNGGYVIDYTTPDADNYKYVGNGYVNMDYPEGKYDILFTYKGKLAYFININETLEPTE